MTYSTTAVCGSLHVCYKIPFGVCLCAHLGGASEVVEGVEGHVQQLVGLPQTVPGAVVSRIQVNCPPVSLCDPHTTTHVLRFSHAVLGSTSNIGM